MIKDKALKMALEALEIRCGTNAEERGPYGAITAIREALAQPEQEPVAVTRLEDGYIKIHYLADPFPVGPLYAASLQPAQPYPDEPVKWHHPECEGACIACLIEQVVQETYGSQGLGYLQRHLITTPKRKPLTDEDLRKLADKHLFYQSEGYEVSGVFTLARAIEAAHGIQEKNA